MIDAARSRKLAAALAAATLLASGPVLSRADTVELSGGGHAAAGQVWRGESDRAAYIGIRLDDDLSVAVRESRVRRVVRSEDLAEYRRRAEIAGDDPELNYQLARWCKTTPGLPLEHQYEYHLRRTVALDPEHSKARAALGYVKHRGQWRLFSEVKRAEGMVSVSGRWVLPEAEAMERRDEAIEVASKKWGKEIARLRKMALRGNRDGWAALEAIEDPLAAWGVARELQDSRGGESQTRQLRRLWIKLLGRFRNPTAVEALTRTVLEEPDPVIRDLAVDELKEYGHRSAAATLLPMLTSNDRHQVKSAAAALAEFPSQPEWAMTLIEALVTSHKQVIPPGPGTQVGFSNLGGGGMSTGGKAKVVIKKQQNPDVLGLLKELEPGVDYGYDETRWKEHFARKWSRYSGDLRRDP